jgi:AraC-like DNA-binding protein
MPSNRNGPRAVDMFAFVQGAQRATGLWSDGDLIFGVNAVWSCFRSLPIPRTFEEHVRASSAVLRLASGVQRSIGPLAQHIERTREEQTARGKVTMSLLFLSRQFSDPEIDLEAIATTVSLSRFHLSRLIRRHTGFSFPTHLSGFRITDAAVNVATTDASMKEIAYQSGYASPGELNRQFRRWFFMSPSTFRMTALPLSPPRSFGVRRNRNRNARGSTDS